MEETAALTPGPPILPPTPPGLESLYALCRKIYPNQPNPLQVTALVKYWLGGPDPLDYISMYENPGIPHENIPPHWHYISFGLSDLHGDKRVHDMDPDGRSGFGFELTFRLRRQPEETAPPTWPATLMQSLAKYVFQSGNTLCAGDHVSWHCALDNSESRIQHMLMAADVQLRTAQTPFGSVDFIQIVGVCADELRAAQQWNGIGILQMLSRLPGAGGQWLITDMRRGESIFEVDPSALEEVEKGFELEGSNLSGVSARCTWAEHISAKELENLSINNIPGIQNAFSIGVEDTNKYQFDFSKEEGSCLYPEELERVKKLESLHLIFNLEAGSLLPLAIRGRVKHGRHFTFQSVPFGAKALTFVASSVTGSYVNSEHPYVAQGYSWLQVLIPDDLAEDMASAFQVLNTPETLTLPKTFAWPEKKLSITIVADKI